MPVCTLPPRAFNNQQALRTEQASRLTLEGSVQSLKEQRDVFQKKESTEKIPKAQIALSVVGVD